MQMLLKRYASVCYDCVFCLQKNSQALGPDNQKSAVQQVSLFEFNFAVIGLVYDYVNHSK